MDVRRNVSRAAIGGAAAIALLAGIASAQGVAQPIDIPPQPLGSALAELGEETGLQVSADAGLVAGLDSAGVQGTLTPAAALELLLRGTGLAFETLDTGVAVLVEAEVPAPDALGADGAILAQPITVTARRAPRSVSAIPGAVTVIDEEELDDQRQVTRNLQGILQQRVPGFRGATGTKFEGFNALRGRTALVLQNGVPQSVQLRSSGSGILSIDPPQIERIEVVRGANATLGFGGWGAPSTSSPSAPTRRLRCSPSRWGPNSSPSRSTRARTSRRTSTPVSRARKAPSGTSRRCS